MMFIAGVIILTLTLIDGFILVIISIYTDGYGNPDAFRMFITGIISTVLSAFTLTLALLCHFFPMSV